LPPGGSCCLGIEGGGALRLPETIERRLEIGGRIQIVLKEKLHGAFARLAACAHAFRMGKHPP